MDVFYVYLLKCWNNKSAMKEEIPLCGHKIYTGYTNNIFRRLKEHIKGHGGYTKQFKGNIQLGYLEAYNNKKEALHREAELKNKLKKWFGIEQEKHYYKDDKIELITSFEQEHQKELEYIMNKVKELL